MLFFCAWMCHYKSASSIAWGGAGRHVWSLQEVRHLWRQSARRYDKWLGLCIGWQLYQRTVNMHTALLRDVTGLSGDRCDQKVTLGEEWEYDSNQIVWRMWVSLELDNESSCKFSRPSMSNTACCEAWTWPAGHEHQAGLRNANLFSVPLSLPCTFVHGHHDGKGRCVLKQLGLSCRRTEWEDRRMMRIFKERARVAGRVVLTCTETLICPVKVEVSSYVH